MDAVDFFAEHHPSPGFISKALQTLDESLQAAWESVSVHPKWSPGPVLDGEKVCRPHTNPTHYEAGRNELKPTAFEDAGSFGLSVDRLTHVSIDYSLAKAGQRVAESNLSRAENNPERVIFGYSVFTVQDLRVVRVKADGSKDEPRRGLAAYDTALEGEPEHADVCVIAPKSQGGRSARLELFRLGNLTHKLLSTEG